MRFITEDIVQMAAIRTHFPDLAMKKMGVENIEDVDRMVIVREAGVSYPTVVRWMTGEVERFDGDTVKKFCLWLGCEIADLLYILKDASISRPDPN